ncbi:MAG: hypothetical protein PVF96_01720 [Candidatus Bathyarchaeota archaeon]|jgi:glycine hydroxymethyltransferase
MIDEVLNLVKNHEEWRVHSCLNLIPSENLMSPSVQELLSSDLGNRYTARDSFYMGTRYLDEIEQHGEKIAEALFGSETADLRPLSGHIADFILIAHYLHPGDLLMCVSPEDGGYPGIWKDNLSGVLKIQTVGFPFSKHDMNIMVAEAEAEIERVKPKLIIFGASMITFPQPVRELVAVAKENGAVVGYDGSHVLGLIAGRQFQDPLREGASVLLGSTHKSFFGPQGGIILADKTHGAPLKEVIFPSFVDNAHWNRIAALTLALCEMKEFGERYAKQVVENSKTLAKTLFDYGFPVICQDLGFTKSHQVILDYGDYEKGRVVAERLQEANIITDCGIRIGTCEVTRRGMKKDEMEKIAELIKRTIIDKENTENLKEEVKAFINQFQTAQYTFK